MADRQFIVAGKWALASDGRQWILQHRRGGSWYNYSFVHSTKDVLARCMREKGVKADQSEKLLAGLPDSFDAWNRTSDASIAQRGASDEPAN